MSGRAPIGTFNITSDDIIRLKADPYTRIVPKEPPTRHWDPMWSKMKETEITGSHRWNPLFQMIVTDSQPS